MKTYFFTFLNTFIFITMQPEYVLSKKNHSSRENVPLDE